MAHARFPRRLPGIGRADRGPAPSETGGEILEDWRGARRRVSHLKALQFVALCVFGVLAVGATVLLMSSVVGASDVQGRREATFSSLVSARDDLRLAHMRYVRNLVEHPGVPDPEARQALLRSSETARTLAARELRTASPAERQAILQTQAAIIALLDLVARSSHISPTSAAARRALMASGPAADRLTAGIDAWVAAEAVALERGRRETEGIAKSRGTWLVVLVGALALSALLAWYLLDRALRRVIASLDGAAHRLANLASSDPLTGLANHRVLHERLRAEAARAQRHGRELSLVVLDLDHFKRINDTHGHQVGDRVLVEAAARLAEEVREGETFARVGGEEFAWILPETDDLGAWQAAERAREALGREPIAGLQGLTLSAGVCSLAQAGSPGELMRLADGALYWAKAHGRDLAVRYTPEVVEALSAEERAERLERSLALNAVRVLARAVDARDAFTQRHSERVAELAGLLAERMGWPAERVARLREAALVHDVGKIGIPDAILLKPAPLSPEEYTRVQAHAALGAQIVSEALSEEQVAWVRHHHERQDGRGYPDGLAGEDIPDGARILALADAWDAMIAPRLYRRARSRADALTECRRGAGRQWSTEAVAALLDLWQEGLLADAEDATEAASAV
jgi:diguanylate cyclase (GGDEF)-like protein